MQQPEVLFACLLHKAQSRAELQLVPRANFINGHRQASGVFGDQFLWDFHSITSL